LPSSSGGGGDGSGVGIGDAAGGVGEVGKPGFMGGGAGVVGVSLDVAGSVGLVGAGEGNSTQATNNVAVIITIVRRSTVIFFCRVKRLGDIANLLIVHKSDNFNYMLIVQTVNSYLVWWEGAG